ncbi:MAG: amidohydrolase [Betaproteobacteria bacterium]|nr:amidohydrolase [Betaproteobacteria bacterium]
MTAKKRAARQSKRIDVHSHVVPKEMLDALAARPKRFGMRYVDGGTHRRLAKDGGGGQPVFDEFYDAAAKVKGMDRKGLDVSMISAAPIVFFYWLDADAGLEAARLVNDGIANMVRAFPERLMGMGTLPMQHPDAAVAELERIVEQHGFRAVELGTSVGEEQVADKRFRAVLKRAQELDVFIFAHPYSGSEVCNLDDYYLSNLIGNPLQSTIMVSHLMFSGVLDELKKLRICLAHGGGYVPYQIGRFNHGHKVRKETRANTKTTPNALLRRFYYDALTHDARALRYLIDLVGADRVVIGTDAPFDMGEHDPIGMIGKVKGLTAREREQIFCRTPLKLIGKSK